MPLLALVLFVAFVFIALNSIDTGFSPDKGNPKLPTVSQSRKIPLIIGKSDMDGPNVLDATSVETQKIKKDGQTLGYKYLQSVEMAIAYGDENAEIHLYEIWMGDKLAWSGDLTTNTSIYLDNNELFGEKRREGGIKGYVQFIKGNSQGTVDADWEAATGRDQPGYPYLSRLIFKGVL